jgi:Protein of unknown function (DUF1524)
VRRRFTAVAVCLVGVALVVACTSGTAWSGVRADTAGSPQWVVTAERALALLKVEPEGSMAGYSRDRFGPAWQDVDHNGCDTRNDILNRDLTNKTWKDSKHCEVATGTLHEPYTGKTIHFVRGVATSAAVQIDHVVALGDAWVTGAKAWTAAKRLQYANDPVVLLAVDGPANEAKGDDDASEWLPPRKAYDCRYVAKQITIKSKYRLWVTQAEHDAMAAQLARC